MKNDQQDPPPCAWCGAKKKEECKAGENCMQGKQHPGWGCFDLIDNPTKEEGA